MDAKITRWEAEHLMTYWSNALESILDNYSMGCSGSWEWRMDEYANYRLTQLSTLVSPEFKAKLAAEHYKLKEERANWENEIEQPGAGKKG